MRVSAVLRAALLAGAIGGEVAAQQRCTDGSAPVGTIGVGWYHCVGGICRMNDDPASRRFEFTTEPRLRDIEPRPGNGRLMDGDALVAVDGMAITLPEAGRRLARLRPGEEVALTVRRGDALHHVTLTPRAGCTIGRLAVTSDTSHPANAPLPSVPAPVLRAPRPPMNPSREALQSGRLESLKPRPNPGTLGLGVTCRSCGWVDSAGLRRWRARVAPVVETIDEGGAAAAAGLRAGDVLTHIDDLAIVTPEGSDRLADVRGDSTYVIRVLREGRPISVRVRARVSVP